MVTKALDITVNANRDGVLLASGQAVSIIYVNCADGRGSICGVSLLPSMLPTGQLLFPFFSTRFD